MPSCKHPKAGCLQQQTLGNTPGREHKLLPREAQTTQIQTRIQTKSLVAHRYENIYNEVSLPPAVKGAFLMVSNKC